MTTDADLSAPTPTVGPRRVARDTFLIVVAGILGKAASLVTVPLLARLLDPTGYGRADLAYGTAVLLIVLLSFAGDIPAAKAHARAPTEAAKRTVLRTYVWTTLVASAVVAFALVPIAPAIASTLWASPSDGALAVAMLILVPIKSFQSSLANVQRLRSRAGLFAALSSVDLLAQLVFAIGFVAAGFGPTGLILGYAAGSFVGLMAAGWLSRDTLRGPIRLRRARAMIQAGLPFLPPVLAFLVADNIARILIAHYLGVGSVGDLGIALRAASAMSLVAGAFTLAWGPIGLGLSRTQGSSHLFGRMFSTYLTLSILAAIGLGALAPELTRVLGGPQFAGAAPAMPGLLFAAGMTGALFVLATAAGVNDRAHVVASSAIVGAVIQVLASILLLPGLGMPAVAAAAVIGRLVNLGILARAVRHVVEASWVTLSIVTQAGAGVVVGLQYVATLPESLTFIRWLIALAATLLCLRLVAQALRVRAISSQASIAS